MFDWLGDIISGIGNALGNVFSAIGEQISNAIWDTMLQWFYNSIYDAVALFFTCLLYTSGTHEPIDVQRILKERILPCKHKK